MCEEGFFLHRTQRDISHVASSYAVLSKYDSCIFKNVHATKVFLNFPQQLASRGQPASMFDSSSSGQVFQKSQTVCFRSNMGQLCNMQLIIIDDAAELSPRSWSNLNILLWILGTCVTDSVPFKTQPQPHFPCATTNLGNYKNGKHLYACCTQLLHFHFIFGGNLTILHRYFHTLVADVFRLPGKSYISGFILWQIWEDRRSFGTKTRRNKNIKPCHRRHRSWDAWNTQMKHSGPFRTETGPKPRGRLPLRPAVTCKFTGTAIQNHPRSRSGMLGHLEAITRSTNRGEVTSQKCCTSEGRRRDEEATWGRTTWLFSQSPVRDHTSTWSAAKPPDFKICYVTRLCCWRPNSNWKNGEFHPPGTDQNLHLWDLKKEMLEAIPDSKGTF